MEVNLMQAKEVEALITAMVEPLLVGTDMTLVDVEYVREKDWYLRIFLDKPGGVEIDDCQLVSEKLTAVLDEKDPIPDKYFLEVSSPGIERVLKYPWHFSVFVGEDIAVKLYAPLPEAGNVKQLRGILEAYDEDEDVLHLRIGETRIDLPRAKAAAVHAAFDF